MPSLLLIITLRLIFSEVSKYYDPECLQNFLLIFVSLLTAPVVKTVIFWLSFTLSFLQNALDQTSRLSIPNLDLRKKVGKVVINKCKFYHFFANQLLYFQFQTVLNILELPKLSNKVSLKRPGASQGQKNVSRYNHIQNI